jgi:hypothetical protein
MLTNLLSHNEQEELFLSAPVESKECQDVLKALDFEDDAYWDTYGELCSNGMFRNREEHGMPISGSDAECLECEFGEKAYWENLIGKVSIW